MQAYFCVFVIAGQQQFYTLHLLHCYILACILFLCGLQENSMQEPCILFDGNQTETIDFRLSCRIYIIITHVECLKYHVFSVINRNKISAEVVVHPGGGGECYLLFLSVLLLHCYFSALSVC